MASRRFRTLSGVVFLTGPPGAGKSSVAHELTRRHPRAAHIDVDALRAFVRSGFADPTLAWSDETREQFRLARTAARAIAEIYVAAGYLAIIDDMFVPDAAHGELWATAPLPILGRIVLLPETKVALKRNARRKRGKVTRRLASLIPGIAGEFAEADADGWDAIDSSAMTVEETADRVTALLTSRRRPRSRRPESRS